MAALPIHLLNLSKVHCNPPGKQGNKYCQQIFINDYTSTNEYVRAKGNSNLVVALPCLSTYGILLEILAYSILLMYEKLNQISTILLRFNCKRYIMFDMLKLKLKPITIVTINIVRRYYSKHSVKLLNTVPR